MIPYFGKYTLNIHGRNVNLEVREMADMPLYPIETGQWKRAIFILEKEHMLLAADIFNYLAALDKFPEYTFEVICFIAESEHTARHFIPRRLEMEPSMTLVYDETGWFEEHAVVRSDIIEIDGENTSLNITSDDISSQQKEKISSLALASARSGLLLSIGVLDDKSARCTYDNVKNTIEALGMGYVSFPLTKDEFDMLKAAGYKISGEEEMPPALCQTIMKLLKDEMPHYAEWQGFREISNKIKKMMKLWQYAIETAGLPVNLVGYRFDEPEIYRDVNVSATRKLGKIIGADILMESYFIDNIPFEDLVA